MYYCINKYHWKPSEVRKIFEDEEEKAFLHATITVRIESEKELERELERKTR